MALSDLDGDGVKELMTIEPFHGNTIKVYRMIDGQYQEVWKYDNPIDFAHTLVGCKIAGKNSFVVLDVKTANYLSYNTKITNIR